MLRTIQPVPHSLRCLYPRGSSGCPVMSLPLTLNSKNMKRLRKVWARRYPGIPATDERLVNKAISYFATGLNKEARVVENLEQLVVHDKREGSDLHTKST
jgi:hypothetical protein